MNRRNIIAVTVVILALTAICFGAAALDLSEVDPNTAISGWAFSSQPGHMGTKNLTYSYYDSTVLSAYSTFVDGGIALWGDNINMTYTSDPSEAGLVFYKIDLPSKATASTQVISYDSQTEHRTKCVIYIYSDYFDSNVTDGKYRTIAHELGHVYGLGDMTSFANHIMYAAYSTTKNVTSDDIWGMKVVTHAHIHGTLFMGTYEVVNASYHDITCSSCYGKIRRVHSPNGFGVCACGYTGPFISP